MNLSGFLNDFSKITSEVAENVAGEIPKEISSINVNNLLKKETNKLSNKEWQAVAYNSGLKGWQGVTSEQVFSAAMEADTKNAKLEDIAFRSANPSISGRAEYLKTKYGDTGKYQEYKNKKAEITDDFEKVRQRNYEAAISYNQDSQGSVKKYMEARQEGRGINSTYKSPEVEADIPKEKNLNDIMDEKFKGHTNGHADAQAKLDRIERQQSVNASNKPFIKKVLDGGTSSQDIITNGYEETIKRGNKHSTPTKEQHKKAMKDFVENGGKNPGSFKEFKTSTTERAKNNNIGGNDTDTAKKVLNDATTKDGLGIWNTVKKHPGATAAIGLGAAWGISELTEDNDF